MIHVPKLESFTVRSGGTKVLLSIGGKVVVLPWKAADELARALRVKARHAEEIEKNESIAFDAAILMRAGAPFGLTSHPKIQDEAVKAAAWDTKLRRRMPGGIKAKAIFGAPSIIVHPPKQTKENTQ